MGVGGTGEGGIALRGGIPFWGEGGEGGGGSEAARMAGGDVWQWRFVGGPVSAHSLVLFLL